MANPPVECTGGRDGGFTVVEAIVATTVATFLLIALTGTLTAALRQSKDIRYSGQGATLALEGVEFARSLDWSQLAMDAAAPDTDPRVQSGQLIGSTVGLPADESLVDLGLEPFAALPYTTSEILDGQPFTIYHYVTAVEPGLRRVVVVVEWSAEGSLRDTQLTTLVSEEFAG